VILARRSHRVWVGHRRRQRRQPQHSPDDRRGRNPLPSGPPHHGRGPHHTYRRALVLMAELHDHRHRRSGRAKYLWALTAGQQRRSGGPAGRRKLPGWSRRPPSWSGRSMTGTKG
jgi:hypothetical protein